MKILIQRRILIQHNGIGQEIRCTREPNRR